MQTFLPYPSFLESARCLDNKRLGKQRVETWQILQAISNPSYGWQNHPAVNMWRGHESALVDYGLAICDEWIARGYRDTVRSRFIDQFVFHGSPSLPTWLGNSILHASHRSALLFKDHKHYGQFGWSEKPDTPNEKGSLNYFWPV